MFRFLGFADDAPKQSEIRRPKTEEELEAARREIIARDVHAEERRAEFEEIVDRCCPDHVLTVRYYFDSETLDWKMANNPDGISLINQFHLCPLRNAFSSWYNFKAYFQWLLTGEKELNPKEVKRQKRQERMAERRRRGLYVMTSPNEPVSSESEEESEPEEAVPQEDDDSDGLHIVPSAAEIESRWKDLMELMKQKEMEENVEEIVEDEDDDDDYNIDDLSIHIVYSAISIPSFVRFFPNDNLEMTRFRRVWEKDVHENLNKPTDSLTTLIFRRPNYDFDNETRWAKDTFGSSEATSKAPARPKSDYVDSEIESERKQLKSYRIPIEQILEQERIVRCKRVTDWLNCPPFVYRTSELQRYAESTEFTVGVLDRASFTFALDLGSLADSYVSTVSDASSRNVIDSYYSADISDLTDRYQSFMVRKRGFRLPYYMLDFDGYKLFSDPIIGRAEVFPANEPIFKEYKGAFCESRTTASMSNCDLIRFYPIMPGPRWHARVYGKIPLASWYEKNLLLLFSLLFLN